MNAEQRANYIINEFNNGDLVSCSDMMAYAGLDSVRCAIICVNLIIDNYPNEYNTEYWEDVLLILKNKL